MQAVASHATTQECRHLDSAPDHLPEEVFASTPSEPQELSRELLALFLVEMARQRRLAQGKAAELAGMPLMPFVRWTGQHGVSVFDPDPGELAAGLGASG